MEGKRSKPTRPTRKRRSPEQALRALKARIDELTLKVHKETSFSPLQVRAEIERLGLTAGEYARILEVTRPTVVRWSKGQTRPRGKILDRWFAIQGITREQAMSLLGLG